MVSVSRTGKVVACDGAQLSSASEVIRDDELRLSVRDARCPIDHLLSSELTGTGFGIEVAIEIGENRWRLGMNNLMFTVRQSSTSGRHASSGCVRGAQGCDQREHKGSAPARFAVDSIATPIPSNQISGTELIGPPLRSLRASVYNAVAWRKRVQTWLV